MKQDIASAVNHIPGLIYESLKEEKQAAKDTTPSKPPAPVEKKPSGLTIRMYRERQAKGQAAKKKLLVMGVVCITLVIVTMWAWNMRIFWYRTQELTKEEPKLWDDSRDNLLEVLNKAKAEENTLNQLVEKIEKEETKKEGQKAFTDAISSLLGTSTTTPSTTTTTAAEITTSTTSSTPKEE